MVDKKSFTNLDHNAATDAMARLIAHHFPVLSG